MNKVLNIIKVIILVSVIVITCFTIYYASYYSSYESVQCKLLNITNSKCNRIDSDVGVSYTYSIISDVLINNNTINNVKGLCYDDRENCDNCKMIIVVKHVYSCWKLSNAQYTLYTENDDPYYTPYVFLVILSVAFIIITLFLLLHVIHTYRLYYINSQTLAEMDELIINTRT